MSDLCKCVVCNQEILPMMCFDCRLGLYEGYHGSPTTKISDLDVKKTLEREMAHESSTTKSVFYPSTEKKRGVTECPRKVTDGFFSSKKRDGKNTPSVKTDTPSVKTDTPFLHCKRCNHKWIYRGQNKKKADCPSCHTTVRFNDEVEA